MIANSKSDYSEKMPERMLEFAVRVMKLEKNISYLLFAIFYSSLVISMPHCANKLFND
jgi:hypothetical protein